MCCISVKLHYTVFVCYVQLHICVFVSVLSYMIVRVCVCASLMMCGRMRMCMYVSVCVGKCVRVCVCVADKYLNN
jgi:hypothetical protein